MTLTAQQPGRFKLPLRNGARPTTQPAAGLRRSQPGLGPLGQSGTFALCKGSECALVVSSDGSAKERNPTSRWASTVTMTARSLGRRKPRPKKKPNYPADRADSPVIGRLVHRNRALRARLNAKILVGPHPGGK